MATQTKNKLISWQLPMQRVLYALIPIILASIYFFGWYSLLLLIVVNAAGFLTEYLFVKGDKQPVTSAVFVSSCLLALSLPPTIPIWMAIVGIVFGITFGKMVFGGFGKNIFNPALTGRAFLYVSFGIQMTNNWVNPVGGFPGGFGAFASDAVTSATPLSLMREGTSPNLLFAFFGNIAGSLGETCAFLIILCGIYIIWKKAANFRIVIGGILGMAALQTIFWLAKIGGASDPISALLCGGFLLGVFFFATDPITAAQTDEGRWIFGAFVGAVSVVIRVFSAWPEGIMFAILLGNMFAPITDHYIRGFKQKAKLKQKEAAA